MGGCQSTVLAFSIHHYSLCAVLLIIQGLVSWVRRSSNGRMGTSAPTPGYDRFRRGRCPQRPVDNGCTPVVPLIRHGLRPCHLLPCGAKAMTVLTSLRQTLWRSPHPSRLRSRWQLCCLTNAAYPLRVLRHATFPRGEGFQCFTPPSRFWPGCGACRCRSPA